jgi:hypothetical protein
MTPRVTRFVLTLLVITSPMLAIADEPPAKALTSDELAAWIDQQFGDEWKGSGFEPLPVVDDATFLRRVFLDLTGSIPSVSQAREFLEYSGDHNRAILIDRLLSEKRRPEKFEERTARHWATLWRRMMVPGNTPQAQQAVGLEPWLKEQFAKNVPYDQFARQLVTASNDNSAAMATVPGAPPAMAQPAMFFQVVGGKPETAASSVSRIFLGTRIGCAECHDHPFASWKQADFWGMAAFFNGVRDGVVADAAVAKIRPMNSEVEYAAMFLGGEEAKIDAGQTPREALADWMVSSDNKQFAATAVNRVWLYLLGRGMTDSVDDLDQASEGERKILDELAQLFVQSGYDLRWLISGICKSQLYQRECLAIDETSAAPPLGARIVKSLNPEQVFDSLEQALALPVSRADGSARFNGLRDQLIARMNEAASNNPADYKAGIPQALLLMNGRLTTEATDLDQSRTLRGVLEAPFLSEEAKLDTLYLAVFSRRPNDEERAYLVEHVRKHASGDGQKQAFAEIFWGLLNSPEFVFER